MALNENFEQDGASDRNQSPPPPVTSSTEQYTAVGPSPKKSNKGKIIGIVAACIVLIAIIGGVVSFNNAEAEKRAQAEAKQKAEDYYSTAKQFGWKVLSSAVVLEDVGNEISAQWKAYIGSSGSTLEDYISKAQKTKADDILKAKALNTEVTAMYSTLMKVPDTNNPEMTSIKAAADKLYSSYQDIYSCVINPTGNYSTWTSEFSKTDSGIVKEYDKYKVVAGQ